MMRAVKDANFLTICRQCCAGQGNYGYANSVCDMLCMSRRAAGKPALAIAWGPVDHVGYVAEILKVCTPFLCISCTFPAILWY